MSTARILALAATLAGLATATAAQTSAATGMPPGGDVQPVHDQQIFTHVLWIAVMGVYWALSDYCRSFARTAAWLVSSGFSFIGVTARSSRR